MSKIFPCISICTFALIFTSVQAAQPAVGKKSSLSAKKFKNVKKVATKKNIQAFTAKSVGRNVRIRATADLDAQVVGELKKDDYVVVLGEKGDFYAVEPLSGTKAYIFRGFVIDGCVEGQHVNVRLAPNRDALVIGHYSTGKKIEGKVDRSSNKWLEIETPATTRFYVAKEYLKYVGNKDMKAIYDKRKEKVTALLGKANKCTLEEFQKTFQEINIEKVTDNYKTIVNDFNEFKDEVKLASNKLLDVQESYLRKKITYLESQTLQKPGISYASSKVMTQEQSTFSPADLMKMWEPVEESLFTNWASSHLSKDIRDFYAEQKRHGVELTGTIEKYRDPVFNAPGSFLLKVEGRIHSYLYSTQVDLSQFEGKKISIKAQSRDNNNFAFPAFYVLDAE
ncbi:hypothetical protein COB21_02335 [Candidatus Aerophobetes bacterium]|uniref:SH3b domain-containing protein n=1 Tax=Aerophobetes bacterium TaxID=2030807 RepID=A0A2A4X5N9_UNCAE|nr:MAG: hypothetical protein COB21_02335 [Candidatus Aerophobetes bacterium]